MVQPNVPEEQEWTGRSRRQLQQQLVTAPLEQALIAKPRADRLAGGARPHLLLPRLRVSREASRSWRELTHTTCCSEQSPNTRQGAPLNSAVAL